MEHKCQYIPKGYKVLQFPKDDVACIAAPYSLLGVNDDSGVCEYRTNPTETETIYFCPWCGEELLSQKNYG